MLWRLTYTREGAERRVTYAAADLCRALEWADRWQATHGDRGRDLTVESLPPSRFGRRLVGGAESQE